MIGFVILIVGCLLAFAVGVLAILVVAVEQIRLWVKAAAIDAIEIWVRLNSAAQDAIERKDRHRVMMDAAEILLDRRRRIRGG